MRSLPGPGRLRELTAQVAWGLAAERLPAGGVLLALPHAADLGTGEAYLHWSPSIVVTPGTAVTWRLVERGVTHTGQFTVHAADDVDGQFPPGAPAPVARSRRALIDGGRQARFTLTEELERHVIELLEAANRFVARELEGRAGDETETWAPTANHGVVDRVALEGLSTTLLWGEDTQPDSAVLRMVTRAATTHINNQPLGSWFHINLRARCEEAVRRHIGDPHIGRKIRRLAREQGPSSIDELLELYRAAHPKESVGRDRVIAALSADKTLDSLSHSLTLLANVQGSHPSLEEPSEAEAAA